MTTFHEDIQRWSEVDPQFAYELALAAAESSLGEQTADIRERLNLTQTEVGRLMGVRQPSVARFEGADRTPTVETLWKVATALGCEFIIGPHFSVRVESVGQAAITADAASVAGIAFDGAFARGASGSWRATAYAEIAHAVPSSGWPLHVTMNGLQTGSKPVTRNHDQSTPSDAALLEFKPAA